MSQSVLPPSESPTLTQRLRAWIDEDPTNRKLHLGSAGTIAALLGLCLFLGTRPPEQITTPIHVPIKAQLVQVLAQSGDNLGSIGAKDDVSRITMVGLNIDLIRKKTAECGDKRTGKCKRDDFGEEKDLAFDALDIGDGVWTIKKGTLEVPALATNG